VLSLVVSDSVVYLAGGFHSIGGRPRRFAAALDTATGAATSWDPTPNDWVRSLALGRGAIYLGGDFTSVGGQPRQYIAAVDGVSGATSSWDAGCNSVVEALAVSDTTVYVGGFFNLIGGSPRHGLAALSARTGTASTWGADAESDEILLSHVITIAVDAGVLYAGGAFNRIGGLSRNHLAAVNTLTAEVLEWKPDPDGYVLALAVDHRAIYAVGTFSTMGPEPRVGIAQILLASELPKPEPVSSPRLRLAQNSPNPAAAVTAVRFSLPVSGPVTLSVYDLQGRKTESLCDNLDWSAGSHEVLVYTTGWPAGCYIYRLEASGSLASRKMLVVH
jgi:hypothetical protein